MTAGLSVDLELIDGLVEARMRVHVRAEPHPERLDERDDVLPGKMRGSVEAHVFNEMRQPPLIVVLEHRAGVDDEPEFGAALRLRVRPDEVLHAVGKPAGADLRIDRDDLGQRVLRRPAGWRWRLGPRDARRPPER